MALDLPTALFEEKVMFSCTEPCLSLERNQQMARDDAQGYPVLRVGKSWIQEFQPGLFLRVSGEPSFQDAGNCAEEDIR